MKATPIKSCSTVSSSAVPGARQPSFLSHLPRRAAPVIPPPPPQTVPRSERAAPIIPRMAKPAPTPEQSGGPASARAVPRVLHIDSDNNTAQLLTSLLAPEARVIHVATVAQARSLLGSDLFALVVLDPSLSDGDGSALLPALATTPLLVYSARQPEWLLTVRHFLPKPWTSSRQLWSAVSAMLGIAPGMTAGD